MTKKFILAAALVASVTFAANLPSSSDPNVLGAALAEQKAAGASDEQVMQSALASGIDPVTVAMAATIVGIDKNKILGMMVANNVELNPMIGVFRVMGAANPQDIAAELINTYKFPTSAVVNQTIAAYGLEPSQIQEFVGALSRSNINAGDIAKGLVSAGKSADEAVAIMKDAGFTESQLTIAALAANVDLSNVVPATAAGPAATSTAQPTGIGSVANSPALSFPSSPTLGGGGGSSVSRS